VRKIIRFQTSDGAIHETEKEARKYCEEKCGEIICKHVHYMLANNHVVPQYGFLLEYVESMLPSMALAYEWRREGLQALVDDEES